jgi:hypothetical protein
LAGVLGVGVPVFALLGQGRYSGGGVGRLIFVAPHERHGSRVQVWTRLVRTRQRTRQSVRVCQRSPIEPTLSDCVMHEGIRREDNGRGDEQERDLSLGGVGEVQVGRGRWMRWL